MLMFPSVGSSSPVLAIRWDLADPPLRDAGDLIESGRSLNCREGFDSRESET